MDAKNLLLILLYNSCEKYYNKTWVTNETGQTDNATRL